MSTVAQLLARGSGPARVRARLREQTRALNRTAVRLSAEQARSARLVDAPLPESVLGGDLLGMLSGPLRALLRVETPDPAGGEPAPGARPRFDVPASQRKHKPAHQTGGGADREFHRAGAGGPNGQGKKGRDPEAVRKLVSQSQQDSGASGPAALWPAPDRPGSADGIATGEERVTGAKWGDGASQVKRPTAATLLAREVDELHA